MGRVRLQALRACRATCQHRQGCARVMCRHVRCHCRNLSESAPVTTNKRLLRLDCMMKRSHKKKRRDHVASGNKHIQRERERGKGRERGDWSAIPAEELRSARLRASTSVADCCGTNVRTACGTFLYTAAQEALLFVRVRSPKHVCLHLQRSNTS